MQNMRISLAYTKNYINNHLNTFLLTDGFVYSKRKNEYQCKKGDTTYIFNVLVTAWSSSYSISLRLWISQQQIEDRYAQILGYKDHGLTCSQEHIERIFYSKDGRENGKGEGLSVTILEEADLDDAVNKLFTYYKNIAIPYFDKFKTLEDFDNFINNEPFAYSPAFVGSYTKKRCVTGLIVAKLVNNPKYLHLVSIYDELIKETVSDVQPDSIIIYERAKLYLNSMNYII